MLFYDLTDPQLFLIHLAFCILFLLPAFIAFGRGHQNAKVILATTIFLGWSVILWIVALGWSLTPVTRESTAEPADLPTA